MRTDGYRILVTCHLDGIDREGFVIEPSGKYCVHVFEHSEGFYQYDLYEFADVLIEGVDSLEGIDGGSYADKWDEGADTFISSGESWTQAEWDRCIEHIVSEFPDMLDAING